MIAVDSSGIVAVERWRNGPDIRTVDFNATLFEAATDVFKRYGKGGGSGVNLNYGDCMAYAVARAYNVPLLYKGGDFSKTDITPALP